MFQVIVFIHEVDSSYGYPYECQLNRSELAIVTVAQWVTDDVHSGALICGCFETCRLLSNEYSFKRF